LITACIKQQENVTTEENIHKNKLDFCGWNGSAFSNMVKYGKISSRTQIPGGGGGCKTNSKPIASDIIVLNAMGKGLN
jgi:hypothetical protein